MEKIFQVITDVFSYELKLWGYPKATFFCMAIVVAFNLSTVKAALEAAHSTGKIALVVCERTEWFKGAIAQGKSLLPSPTAIASHKQTRPLTTIDLL